MTDLILATGKVMLRCGYEVRVHATNLSGDRPVLLSYLMPDKGWFALFSLQDGRQLSGGVDHQFDLIPIPQAQYFNVYEDLDGSCLIADLQDDIRDALTEAQEYSFKYVSFETFQYLDGEITKVEESSDVD